MDRFPLVCLLVVVAFLAPACAPGPDGPPAGAGSRLILVSIDGFRADYLDRHPAPTLRGLAAEGVRAERLVPSFPSKTFPNHYTLVTGLYPEHHGIVGNVMYDPVFGARFSLSDREAVTDARWWGGEPIWVTAERQGLTAATYFWPGSEAAIQGVRPTYWKTYDGAVPAPERVREVLAWLDLPEEERPELVTLYFSAVDEAGHDHGPDSPETAAAVARIDAALGLLVDGLAARGLTDAVNLIVTADHGMAATSRDRVILLDDYVDLDDVRITEGSPSLMLWPEPGREETVYRALRFAPHLEVYRKEDVPERFHFREHRRIPPIVAIADEGWEITTRARYRAGADLPAGGTHGYDPELPSMGALFVARGPAFRKGLTVGPFSNVHVYNLMTAVLGLEPAPNDGDLDAVRRMLAREVVVR